MREIMGGTKMGKKIIKELVDTIKEDLKMMILTNQWQTFKVMMRLHIQMLKVMMDLILMN
jgi:hypothetical protein